MKTRDAMKGKILAAAVTLASTEGLAALTRDGVAHAAGVSNGSVNFYYQTMAYLTARVMRQAVAQQLLSVIAEGIAARHPVACGAPRELRRRAMAHLAK